ncbi:MAG TPA: septal ring lytic transglycosylase RlpA family protein [Candidatus Eisenbacteria bacterium]|nr:septal ring lytic transglycosylase RlpA family protein [Candidatus Eisenbacteria bacterium]
MALAIAGCATTHGVTLEREKQVGIASYYAGKHHGRRTASGERFDMQELTAAHRTLPFGTRVRVTNLANGRRTVVRINDRGPYRKGRIIDLSYAAARELQMRARGVTRVRLEIVGS